MAGVLAALPVARDAPNFLVAEAMVGLALIAAVVLALALIRRR